MKLAIISLKSKSSEMIAEESKKYFSEVDMLDLRKIEIIADSENIQVLYEKEKLKDYDAVYCRGSYKYAMLLRSLSAALYKKVYLPLCPECFTIGHHKYLTLLELQRKGINIPRTYLAANTNAAKEIIKNIHYPAIIKTPGGTHGKGVLFADSIESANSILDALEVFRQSYIIQEYIETGATDIRAVVADGKVVAAMKRKAHKGDLRANIHSGGSGEKIELDRETEEMAIKSAHAIGADICAVDLLKGIKTCVIEVNISPGIQGITRITKQNVAGDIAKILHEMTLNFIKTKKNCSYDGMLKELDIKTDEVKNQEVVANIDLKLGKIKLPEIASRLSGFRDQEEVVMKLRKGAVIIKRVGG